MALRFQSKPPAPSVRAYVGPAIERSRRLSTDEKPMTQKEIAQDVMRKLTLPPSLKAHLRQRHGIDED